MSEKLEAAAHDLRDRITAAAIEVSAAHGVQVSVRRLLTAENTSTIGVDVEALVTVTPPGVFSR